MELKKRHETRVYRNAYGTWAAEDSYRMPDGRALNILTMKRYGGAVVTTAKVTQPQHGAMMYSPFDDFNERLGQVGMRCTEKSVREFHEKAASPENVAAVMERAVAHYSKTVKA